MLQFILCVLHSMGFDDICPSLLYHTEFPNSLKTAIFSYSPRKTPHTRENLKTLYKSNFDFLKKKQFSGSNYFGWRR